MLSLLGVALKRILVVLDGGVYGSSHPSIVFDSRYAQPRPPGDGRNIKWRIGLSECGNGGSDPCRDESFFQCRQRSLFTYSVQNIGSPFEQKIAHAIGEPRLVSRRKRRQSGVVTPQVTFVGTNSLGDRLRHFRWRFVRNRLSARRLVTGKPISVIAV